MFFYTATPTRGEFQGDVWKMKANVHYMTHFNNRMFLLLLTQEGTFVEKQTAEAEIVICDRKLKFWERHPNFDAEIVRVEKEKVVKQWKGRV